MGMSKGTVKHSIAVDWFRDQGWEPFEFQLEAWDAYSEGKSGIVNAPTGSGKTYSLWFPILSEFIKQFNESPTLFNPGLRALWITPIRALSKEIHQASNRVIEDLDIPFKVGIRTGDTPLKVRDQQKKNTPQMLITTPESLHLLLASKGYHKFFKELNTVVVDEWHELMGSKRGVLMELALSRLKAMRPKLKVWGISATIGNMTEAVDVLLGPEFPKKKSALIRSGIEKKIEVESIFPDDVHELPWAGHLGIRLLEKIIPVIQNSTSTIIFTNTRSQAEIWYQRILDVAPDLAGVIAMHHGSISQELRHWVEDALYDGRLKAVVSTSSLDLGVDFRPVESVIQIGGPKGMARFLQRAGRSGHSPGAVSKIYFLPTHSLELIEAAALREGVNRKIVEGRVPFIRSFDVLVQYLLTLAVSEGFKPSEILPQIRSTHCYNSVSDEEWLWVLRFITTGGPALHAYDEYRKVEVEEGVFKINSRRIAMRHRMSIGTIVSDPMLNITLLNGKRLGSIEEYFISKLNIGEVFWFAGQNLELVRIKDMNVQVRKSNKKSGKVPSWQGGRMPLSSEMSQMLRYQFDQYLEDNQLEPEVTFMTPLLDIQQKRSILPSSDQFLIEYYESKDGHHVLMFPMEGRAVHEGMAALVAHRISMMVPISFSIAMNDYGFELLSDKPIPLEEALETNVLGAENLVQDIMSSVNATEMARRRFRDIASISGLIFKGFPGKQQKERHVQSSASLFFEVFQEYESDNLILREAFEEILIFQLEEIRLRETLERINNQEIVVTRPSAPTPLAFPVMVDRLGRERISSETMEDRIKRMELELTK